VIGVVALAVVWLSGSRQLALLLDRFITGGAVSLPVDRLVYDGGGFFIGDRSMTFGQTNNLRADLCLTFDSSNRVVLSEGHKTFILGPLRPAGGDTFGIERHRAAPSGIERHRARSVWDGLLNRCDQRVEQVSRSQRCPIVDADSMSLDADRSVWD
jgi:hypothetical protein